MYETNKKVWMKDRYNAVIEVTVLGFNDELYTVESFDAIHEAIPEEYLFSSELDATEFAIDCTSEEIKGCIEDIRVLREHHENEYSRVSELTEALIIQRTALGMRKIDLICDGAIEDND
ncbi:hypothetical protein N9137_00980 [Pseudomonadales bacterium]|nr:hypothetical protein [Pseudomonadales bacterium]